MKGFSLIETLVAIVVLIGAVTGPLTLASHGIKAASLFKNQLIASNLGQEGMELVHARRDSNVLSGLDWMDSITSQCSGAGCFIRYTPTDNSPTQITFQACDALPGGICPKFFITPGGWYVQKDIPGAGDIETNFRRTIKTTLVTPGREIKVSTTIEWMERFSPLTLELEENLLRWP